jgi:hypothetical protein
MDETMKTIKKQIENENEPEKPATKIWDLPVNEILDEIIY